MNPLNKSIFILVIAGLFFSFSGKTQSRPRLIVGITVDQMRWDYLYRFQHRWSEKGGFKRLLQQGFTCERTFITHAPTVTASGHAGIYTGSVPAINGITGNEWYDNNLLDFRYCTADKFVQTVGSISVEAGQMSPVNLLTTTICDELQLATNFRSKTIGIAIKDRGGILAAGHSATAAYWYDSKEGQWITSTYYMKALPDWVTAFQTKAKVDSLYKLDWKTLYDPKTYTQSVSEKKNYEIRSFGSPSRQFPYALAGYAGVNYGILPATPQGSTLTTEFAKSAILGEKMGMDSVTDFLALSYSSPDYIGHSFGPNSMEIEDTYLRLDLELGSLLDFLDKQVGTGKYLIFLSADHGVAHVPGFMAENKLPGGLINDKVLNDRLNDEMKKQFGTENLSLGIVNFQVVLNMTAINKSNKLKQSEITDRMINWLEAQEVVSRAISLNNLGSATLPEKEKQRFANGYYPSRSGHIQIIYKPGYIEGFDKGGTTHGAWNPYDAHIPLIWYGWQIPAGKTVRETAMADIAPTLAALLNIQEPNGSIGQVVSELFR